MVDYVCDRIAHFVVLLRAVQEVLGVLVWIDVLCIERGRAWEGLRVKGSRVEPNAAERLGMEANTGVRPEALANHPAKRNASKGVSRLVGHAASADVCVSYCSDIKRFRRLQYIRRTTVAPGEPHL